jgi:hypothetical protein
MNILLIAYALIGITCIQGMHHKFLLDNEGWQIKQHQAPVQALAQAAPHYTYNTGILSRYIGGKDTLINVDWKNKDDKDLWYFVLEKPTHKIKSYVLSYKIQSFAGDFTRINEGVKHRAVIMKSNTSELWIPAHADYDGSPKTFWISLLNVPIKKKEMTGGFSNVGNRELKKILNEITEIAILGDWTRGIEMIGIDDVEFT